MSVARCRRTMATGQRGTNWGGSLLIGLVATGAGMQRKPACWRWMAEPRLQRSFTAPRHTIWPFFLVGHARTETFAHMAYQHIKRMSCFRMILPLSLRTTLQHRHRKTTNPYVWNSGCIQPLSFTAETSSCRTKVWLLSEQSISSLIVSRSPPESDKPRLLSHKDTKQSRQRALQAPNTWRHKSSLLGGQSELAFCSRVSGPSPPLCLSPAQETQPPWALKVLAVLRR